MFTHSTVTATQNPIDCTVNGGISVGTSIFEIDYDPNPEAVPTGINIETAFKHENYEGCPATISYGDNEDCSLALGYTGASKGEHYPFEFLVSINY